MEAILIPFIVFATIFGIAFLFFTTRNKERMALIEKGASAELFKNEGNRYTGLKIGILLIGVALGVFIGYMLANSGVMEREVAFPAMIFLFSGIALVSSHFVVKRLSQDS